MKRKLAYIFALPLLFSVLAFELATDYTGEHRSDRVNP